MATKKYHGHPKQLLKNYTYTYVLSLLLYYHIGHAILGRYL